MNKVSQETRYGRFSITRTLVLVVGLLTLVSVGSVLWIGIWLAQKNTFALLSDNASNSVNSTVNSVQQYLASVEYKAEFVADRIGRGEFDPSDHKAMEDVFTGMIIGAAQIDRLMYIDTSLQAFYVRYRRRLDKVSSGIVDYAEDSLVRDKISNLREGANWGEPVWKQSMRKTQLELIHPVYRDGEMIGAIVALLPVKHISFFVSGDQAKSMGSLFVLSGKDKVMGHPLMRKEEYPGMGQDSPLPNLRRFEDPILKSFWDTDGRSELQRLDLPEGIDSHLQEVDGQRFVFFYRQIDDFGPEPLVIGGYFPRSAFSEEVQRIMLAGGVGLFALILALFAAVYIGRKIAMPIANFSSAASRVKKLELSEVEELQGSVFRELDQQSKSFNAMLRALRWFEMYIPTHIVGHLIKQGNASETMSKSRSVTVLFTDIAGFSALSEGLSGQQAAKFLNHHFSLIGKCVDHEKGTIDKYIGDSVMAFWGALTVQEHHAERACRTALAISQAIHEDNMKRIVEGKPPVRIRIGIHSGDVTVGNIGAPGRINYTIIGDAVNIGAHLEQLGKEIFSPEEEASILISGSTAKMLGKAFGFRSVGKYRLKGRDSRVEVFSLNKRI